MYGKGQEGRNPPEQTALLSARNLAALMTGEFFTQPGGKNVLITGLEVYRIYGDFVKIATLLGALLYIDVWCPGSECIAHSLT
jgi:hypothetical protein